MITTSADRGATGSAPGASRHGTCPGDVRENYHREDMLIENLHLPAHHDEIDPGRVIVVGGLPGTGKTTLSRALVPELRAAYLRVDVVETPLERAGVSVGPLGYEIVRDVARSNVRLGVSVVVDLVNPLPITRRIWRDLAAETGADLVVLECYLPDPDEHRRRVQQRRPDIEGHIVPTWDDVVSREYAPWDADRDGQRVRIDMTDPSAGLANARSALGQ